MSKRENYIGTRVSEKEKEEIIELANGMDTTVSDFIRHRVIRPVITLPEAIQNIKLYLDIKFKKFENEINKLIKEQKFVSKPIRSIEIKEGKQQIPQPISETPNIMIDPEKNVMRGVLIEFREKVDRILKNKK